MKRREEERKRKGKRRSLELRKKTRDTYDEEVTIWSSTKREEEGSVAGKRGDAREGERKKNELGHWRSEGEEGSRTNLSARSEEKTFVQKDTYLVEVTG